jgi:hypothetical protein
VRSSFFLSFPSCSHADPSSLRPRRSEAATPNRVPAGSSPAERMEADLRSERVEGDGGKRRSRFRRCHQVFVLSYSFCIHTQSFSFSVSVRPRPTSDLPTSRSPLSPASSLDEDGACQQQEAQPDEEEGRGGRFQERTLLFPPLPHLSRATTHSHLSLVVHHS